MKRLRVLGIGSPFGDDQLGWEAIERLRRTAPEIHGWEIEFDALDRPGPLLLDKMAGADAVILIDAVHSGATPGSVFGVDRAELEGYDDRRSSHSLGVAEVLALGEQLQALPPHLGLIGIELGAAADDRLEAVFAARLRELLA